MRLCEVAVGVRKLPGDSRPRRGCVERLLLKAMRSKPLRQTVSARLNAAVNWPVFLFDNGPNRFRIPCSGTRTLGVSGWLRLDPHEANAGAALTLRQQSPARLRRPNS